MTLWPSVVLNKVTRYIWKFAKSNKKFPFTNMKVFPIAKKNYSVVSKFCKILNVIWKIGIDSKFTKVAKLCHIWSHWCCNNFGPPLTRSAKTNFDQVQTCQNLVFLSSSYLPNTGFQKLISYHQRGTWWSSGCRTSCRQALGKKRPGMAHYKSIYNLAILWNRKSY